MAHKVGEGIFFFLCILLCLFCTLQNMNGIWDSEQWPLSDSALKRNAKWCTWYLSSSGCLFTCHYKETVFSLPNKQISLIWKVPNSIKLFLGINLGKRKSGPSRQGSFVSINYCCSFCVKHYRISILLIALYFHLPTQQLHSSSFPKLDINDSHSAICVSTKWNCII